MRLFVRIVERRSFSQAALDLNLPASTATEGVKQLEARLGVRLLQRTTRHVSPTLDGEAFYRRCLTILGELEDAEAEFSDAKPTRHAAGRRARHPGPTLPAAGTAGVPGALSRHPPAPGRGRPAGGPCARGRRLRAAGRRPEGQRHDRPPSGAAGRGDLRGAGLSGAPRRSDRAGRPDRERPRDDRLRLVGDGRAFPAGVHCRRRPEVRDPAGGAVGDRGRDQHRRRPPGPGDHPGSRATTPRPTWRLGGWSRSCPTSRPAPRRCRCSIRRRGISRRGCGCSWSG